MMINLRQLIDERVDKKEFFYSIEVFPSKNEDDLISLNKNLNLFLNEPNIPRPLFCDVTYHAHSERPFDHPCSSLSIASNFL